MSKDYKLIHDVTREPSFNGVLLHHGMFFTICYELGNLLQKTISYPLNE